MPTVHINDHECFYRIEGKDNGIPCLVILFLQKRIKEFQRLARLDNIDHSNHDNIKKMRQHSQRNREGVSYAD